MIQAQIRLGGEVNSVIVKGNELLFQDVSSGQTVGLPGLRLSKAGALKEHPDLKDNPDWRKISIDRLKEHVKKFSTEMEKINYIKKELEKFGYEPMFYQKAGWRVKKFK